MRQHILFLVSDTYSSKQLESILDRFIESNLEVSLFYIGSPFSPFFERNQSRFQFITSHPEIESRMQLLHLTSRFIKFVRRNTVTDVLISGRMGGVVIVLSRIWVGSISIFNIRHFTNLNHTYAHRYSVILDRVLATISERTIAVSDLVKLTMRNLERIPERKIVVIPHGIDWQECFSSKCGQVNRVEPSNQLRICSVARLTNQKGVLHIAQAISQLIKEGIPTIWTHFGTPGDASREFFEITKDLPSESFNYAGQVEHIHSELLCHNVLINIPIEHDSESFGLVFLEFMMHSHLQFMFTKSGILATDRIFDGTYHEIKHNSFSDLYLKLKLLHEGLLNEIQLTESIKSQISSKYSLKAMADNYLSIIRK